jgi:hypothetical protein
VAPLPAYTKLGAGVGATITAVANGSINLTGIDGYNTFIIGDRILLKNGASNVDNGIWELTTVGTGITPWVFTRATDFDGSTEVFYRSATKATDGLTQTNVQYAIDTPNPIVVDTTPIVYIPTAGLPRLSVDIYFGSQRLFVPISFQYRKPFQELQKEL